MRYFKTVILCIIAAISICACGNVNEGENKVLLEGTLELVADKEQLRSDGEDVVVFTVILTDSKGVEHDVTEDAEIYVVGNQTSLSSNMFTTQTEGKYVVYAVYGLSLSPELTITAFNDVPSLPQDPNEGSTEFKHRILLIQHTGATCSNCPRMMNVLRELSNDASYNHLYHHVASHSYNGGESDAAFSEAAANLSAVVNPEGYYPMLTFNLTDTAIGTDISEIKGQIDLLKKERADAGIAASTAVSGTDVVVNVEVKADVANSYRVAAWLLEDDIYSIQAGMSESWHNTHDNALRYMAGVNSQYSFVGAKLGDLTKGNKASKVFVMPIDKSWKVENCKVLVFVTAADKNGNFDIVNCAICSIDGTVSYDYK